jgi:2-hydroxycyclohexanecarboxyl-CoA dehydrogenase
MRLRDRVAIITGGGSGIGRAIALKFSAEGASIVVADRNEEFAKEVVRSIEHTGGKAIGIRTDVTRIEEVKGMVGKTLQTFGKVDILVNNAGWDKLGPFMETAPQFWDAIIDLNLKAHIYCTRAVLEHMIGKQQGIIVHIASDAGRIGFRGEVVYSAAKGGVIAFVKALAKEVGIYGIRVNSVAPGPIKTPMLEIGLEKNTFVRNEMMLLKELTPLGRFGDPEEVADLVLFLASEESKFITGQVISIDGGLTSVG